jgi:hypothetical protein
VQNNNDEGDSRGRPLLVILERGIAANIGSFINMREPFLWLRNKKPEPRATTDESLCHAKNSVSEKRFASHADL